MGMTAEAALWFLPAVIPIAIYVSWTDMSMMKITNRAVMALVISYAILGLFAFPFEMYLWQWSHLIVMLLIGILFNAAGVMGAGDAKFMAAAAPMIVLADIRDLMLLFAACLVASLIVHRAAKYSPIRKAVPHWKSWEDRKFPKGFPLSVTLLMYLLLVATYR